MVERLRGQKYHLRPALGGLKIFYISFEGVEKLPHCLNKTCIECRGSNFFHSTLEGVKNVSVALRGGSKFLSCYSESPPLPLSYQKQQMLLTVKALCIFACHFPLPSDCPYYLIGGRSRG